MKRSIHIVIALAIGLFIGSATNVFAAIGEKVEAQFSKFIFIVDGKEQKLDADPLVYQGSTYLPVRTVANLLGKDVVYKADSRTIELNTPKIEAEGVKQNVTDLSQYSPELIRGQILSIEADLKRDIYPELREKYEAAIAERKAYLESIGEPVYAVDNNIQDQLEIINNRIDSIKWAVQVNPENEEYKKALAELEAEKAALEAQLQKQ